MLPGPVHILHVEDDDHDADQLRRALASDPAGDITLCRAVRLADAVAVVRQQQIDLILLDLTLPDGRGLDTLHQVHRVAPHVPIVVLTGHDDRDLALAAVQAGAQDYLVKGRPNDESLVRVIHHSIQRARAEEARRDSERRFRIVAETANDAIVCADACGQITFWNRAASAIFGYESSEVIGQPLTTIMSQSIADAHRADAADIPAAVLANFVGRTVELMGRRKDGIEIPVELSLASCVTSRDVFYTGILRDISQRKSAERSELQRQTLKQAVDAMEQILAVVGHELRTPLAAMRAMSEYLLAKREEHTEECTAFISSMNDEAVRMAELVNNMLEAARLNSGCARWNWSKVAFNDTWNQVSNAVDPLIDHHRVDLIWNCEPQLTMQGDADAIRRLLINFISNAAKHTEDGSIRVSARAAWRDGKKWIELEVRDTGDGIPQKLMNKLGQAFALNQGVVGSDYVRGSGLGLAICSGITAAHGGWISVHSKPGQGTMFAIFLRADMEAPSAQTPEVGIMEGAAA